MMTAYLSNIRFWPATAVMIPNHDQSWSGPWFNINMPSYQYRKFHCGDETIVRSSYLRNGISYTGKMSSLYLIEAQLIDCTVAGVNVHAIHWNGICHHFDEIFIAGCTESCHFDNFRCSQWLKFRQNDNIPVSVYTHVHVAFLPINKQNLSAKSGWWYAGRFWQCLSWVEEWNYWLLATHDGPWYIFCVITPKFYKYLILHDIILEIRWRNDKLKYPVPSRHITQ